MSVYILYGHVWAVRITQRLHHIENQHIVGSHTHTNRFHRGAFYLFLSLSLFLRKRSHIEQDLSFCLIFSSSFQLVFFLSLCCWCCLFFFSYTQFYSCISPRNDLHRLLFSCSGRATSLHWRDKKSKCISSGFSAIHFFSPRGLFNYLI